MRKNFDRPAIWISLENEDQLLNEIGTAVNLVGVVSESSKKDTALRVRRVIPPVYSDALEVRNVEDVGEDAAEMLRVICDDLVSPGRYGSGLLFSKRSFESVAEEIIPEEETAGSRLFCPEVSLELQADGTGRTG